VVDEAAVALEISVAAELLITTGTPPRIINAIGGLLQEATAAFSELFKY
jgi:hypothetical protein